MHRGSAAIQPTIRSILAEGGQSVIEAPSADEALAMVEAGRSVDVLVTDHLMSGMTGTELAHIIRARRPHMRILIVSGYAEVEGIAPDLPRLTKPFKRDDLAEALAADA